MSGSGVCAAPGGGVGMRLPFFIKRDLLLDALQQHHSRNYKSEGERS